MYVCTSGQLEAPLCGYPKGDGSPIALSYSYSQQSPHKAEQKNFTRRKQDNRTNGLLETTTELLARPFQVFHVHERKRRADCAARQDELLKGRLMAEERSWELFARAQGELFERALDQVKHFRIDSSRVSQALALSFGECRFPASSAFYVRASSCQGLRTEYIGKCVAFSSTRNLAYLSCPRTSALFVFSFSFDGLAKPCMFSLFRYYCCWRL